MCYKPRSESDDLIAMRILNARMNLLEKDKLRYLNLVKGYEGEVMFDSFTGKLQCQSYILNDLQLELGGNPFQLDSSVLTQQPIYLYEVKNYEGDYYFAEGKFYKVSNREKEILNPLLQIERSESLLRQLLQNLGYRIPIEAYVIFINPEFQLYQAPLNKPIIYPNQLNHFMKMVNSRPSQLDGYHKKLADQLVSLHQPRLHREKLPPYEFGGLRKGLMSACCHTLNTTVVGRKLICGICGHMELLDHAVLRSVKEIQLLFPDLNITTVLVQQWCGVDSAKTIRRILVQNYYVMGNKEYTFTNLK